MWLLGTKYKKKFFLLSVAVFIFASLFVLYLNNSGDDQVPEEYVQADAEIVSLTGNEYGRYFDSHIDIFFKVENIEGLIERVTKALSEGKIGMYECHTVAHNIGHYAGYPENFVNIESYVTKESLDFCGSGFMHGVEGQLANESYPQNIESLYAFCVLTQPFNPYYEGCYHGAGHSFMESTRNYVDALQLCKQLIIGENTNFESCYKGVFSENASIATAGGAKPEDTLEFCSTLEPEYQLSCASEVNGFNLGEEMTVADFGNAINLCLSEKYSTEVQNACIRSVTWTGTDRLLRQRMIEPPKEIFSLDPTQMEVYLEASHNSYLKTSSYDKTVSFSDFCKNFIKVGLEANCLSLIQ